MIVVVLVVIWVIVLTPFLLRRLSEHQVASSAARFRAATGLLRRLYPRQSAVAIAPDVLVAPQPVSNENRRRREIARLRRQRARRRAILVRLLGFTGSTVVLGALPHLHALWDLSIAGVILSAAYVATLYYLAQRPAELPTLHRPVVPGHPYVSERSPTKVAAAGGGPFVIAPIQRRPAFRLVDPNS